MRNIVFISLLMIVSTHAFASSSSCTIARDALAEEAIKNTHDWDSLRETYLQFEGCDNGGTAELFSDLIVRLLADPSNDLYKLMTYTNRNKSFRQFILHHVNSTASADDLKSASNRVNFVCPKSTRMFCSALHAQLDAAMADLADATKTGKP